MVTNGTRVKWITATSVHGSGMCICDEQHGHVLEAVDAPDGEAHRVIYCALT